jgi:pyruvate,orthophosphate dikinase
VIKSKALEINLARTQVEVAIDPRYDCLRAVMADYYGLTDGLNAFLKEVSHPFKNWQYIVDTTRTYSLNYLHLFKTSPEGPEAIERLMGIFLEAMESENNRAVKVDAADNLILLLQKTIRSMDAQIESFSPGINRCFERIAEQPDDVFALFVNSYYSLGRVPADLYELYGDRWGNPRPICRLLVRALDTTCQSWLTVRDPLQWFLIETNETACPPALETIFKPVTHQSLKKQQTHLAALKEKPDTLYSRKGLRQMIEMKHHNDLVDAYRTIPRQLQSAGSTEAQGNQWKVIFLFHIMNIDGLALIHEDSLREINRSLTWLIANQSTRYVQDLVKRTFSILEASARQFPATGLVCVQNMGQRIYQTNNNDLIDDFINAVIRMGFQAPMIEGVGNDWQIKVNNAHIQNIRTWLELIEMNPKRSTKLLSSLVVHLAISGVFIRDIDLFGRDITRMLNHDIEPVYNLTKQLMRLFPVYFNDIGAEGELRDISTRIDELCHRQDPLVHFLRKQSHVEGSNRVLGLLESVLTFWETREKDQLKDFLPPNIYEQIQPKGPYVDGVHKVVQGFKEIDIRLPDGLLECSPETLMNQANAIQDVTSIDRERVVLMSEFYKQLNSKYNLDHIHIQRYVDHLPAEAFPQLKRLRRTLNEKDLHRKLRHLLDYLAMLKNIILSADTYEIREDIYKKRHFTVDIPSMYGSYREQKFDAMGFTLRLEALVNALFEELVLSIDLSLITKATCYQIYDRLRLFDKALKVDGIASVELERQLEMLAHSLEMRGFSFTQYLDIFKGFAQAVKNIIKDYFNSVHGNHLGRIISQLSANQIQKRFHPINETPDLEKLRHRTVEIFFRDRLALSLGLQQLDLFLTRILNTLFNQSNKLPKEKLRLLLNYDPMRAICSLQTPNQKATGLIFLGNKGLNMFKLKKLGIPVPPAFIITTEVFRYREIIETFTPAQENFHEQVAHHIRELETCTGKCFGDPANPLLLSVRSGSSISQPGMMDTFLNVGMNATIAEGLAQSTDNAWFAWDCYRRFLQCYGMALGLNRDDFDAIMGEYKARLNVPLKRRFSGPHMQTVAQAYKTRIEKEGFQIPDAPMEQLHQIIQKVLDSWESVKARTYRHIMGISDDWGTAVTVQSMIFGNLSQESGSGVVFTHNPRWSGESLSLWGDFTTGNQGEDVVSGLVQTLPISVKQQELERRETDITLETHFPKIYATMLGFAHTLVDENGWSPQDMEFTYESASQKDLYILQTRDMAIRERKRVLTFDALEKQSAHYLGHGLGVSGGAMNGRLVFNLEEVEMWRKKEPDSMLILVRGDTVPDDIKEIFATDGLLTARGGVTSHASVVAHRLEKTCVVGCGDMICDERNGTVTFSQHKLISGDRISIDGREGSVYEGALKINEG